MERIVRVFVEGVDGTQSQCLAFDIEKFVSFNVDTRVLQLTNGCHVVCEESVPRLIHTYRLMDEPEMFIYDVPAEADLTIKHWWEFWK